ncbi:MAG TPA: MopE-related protein, partial [Myxococcota bacterium]|nr:MopE-related protein [Myxococcota bacterium]
NESGKDDSTTGTDDSTGSDDSTANNDADADGYDSVASGGDDCDDSDASVNPGATEVAGDGKDNDCDAATPDSGGSRSFSGSVSVYVDNNGSVDCDITVQLAGTEAADRCPDCDFSFAIDATTSDEIGTDCPFKFTYLEDDILKNTGLGFQSTYTYSGYYGEYSYTNLLRTTFSVDYSAYGYGYYEGPYSQFVAYDGSPYGAATLVGNTLSWTYESVYYGVSYSNNLYYSYCDYTYPGYEKYSGAGYTGSWDCVLGSGDVWTFDTVQGATTAVSVDTLSADTTFDPYIYVIASDTCLVGQADDSFDCAFPPPDGYSCPSLTFEGDGQPVTLVVAGITYPAGTDECAGVTGEYELLIDVGADAAANAQQVDDNFDLQTETEYINTIPVEGSGTITE